MLSSPICRCGCYKIASIKPLSVSSHQGIPTIWSLTGEITGSFLGKPRQEENPERLGCHPGHGMGKMLFDKFIHAQTLAFVYIYCLLECTYVWVFPVSRRNVGVFSSAIRLVVREPTPLAVSSLHFLISGLNYVSLCVVKPLVVF